MPNVFHPDHSALDQIFAKDMKFIIPEYQRPYSWQAEGKSDRNNQINQMWEDLWSFFEDMHDDKEYFLGSMVIIERKLRTLEVVDGQQRLTSLVLLFTAMRCFLEQQLAAAGGAALSTDLRPYVERARNKLEELIYNEQTIGLAPELKVKIERSAGNDFDAVLGDAAACKDKSTIAKGDARFGEIARRYFDNRDYFVDQIRLKFLDHNLQFGTEEYRALDRFFTFLQTRVAIVLIKTTDFDTAYSIFEILNNRGLPLRNVDLLRNFVINRLADDTGVNGAVAAAAWYKLEEDYALTDEFTARWVESKTGSKQRQSAFNGVQRIYQQEYRDSPNKKKIDIFYADIERDLGYYSLVAEPDLRVTNARVRNSIKLIAALGNLRYSTTLLLALFRHCGYTGDAPDPAMLALLKAYEQNTLSICLHPRKRFSSTSIFQAIRLLRDRKPAEAAQVFVLDEDELRALSARFDGPVDNYVAKLLLAIVVWAQEEEVDDVVTQRLDFAKATLEHIIPGSPKPGSNWMTDFSDAFRAEYTNRIGNMTLLTSKMNSQAKNSDFSKKKPHYTKTLLDLTREIAALDTITEGFIRARHVRIVSTLRARWGLPAA